MPVDPEHGPYVNVNPQMLRDSRVRQLAAEQQWYLHALSIEAANENGWVPIPAGETAADVLLRVSRLRPEDDVTTVQTQAALDRLEHVGLIAVGPGRIRMTAPELFSYVEDPPEVSLLDYQRLKPELDTLDAD